MKNDTPPPNVLTLNFMALSASAITCSMQWKEWAALETTGRQQARFALDLAFHFEEQAKILARMHQFRTVWRKPSKADFQRLIP